MRSYRALHREQGFTLIEVMMTVMLIGILSSMAVFQIAAVRPGMLADGAMRVAMGQLNYARETAISQRREIRIDADATNNRLRIIRLPLPGAVDTTTLSDVTFEGGMKIALLAGATTDTPDKFGIGSAVDFDADPIKFTTDGTLVNSSGAPVNGTVYLVIPGTASSFRAVTVLGATGRVRGYRWAGTHWMR